MEGHISEKIVREATNREEVFILKICRERLLSPSHERQGQGGGSETSLARILHNCNRYAIDPALILHVATCL